MPFNFDPFNCPKTCSFHYNTFIGWRTRKLYPNFIPSLYSMAFSETKIFCPSTRIVRAFPQDPTERNERTKLNNRSKKKQQMGGKNSSTSLLLVHVATVTVTPNHIPITCVRRIESNTSSSSMSCNINMCDMNYRVAKRFSFGLSAKPYSVPNDRVERVRG